MLEEKKLSNEEKENLQKSAELLSQVVIKNDSNTSKKLEQQYNSR